MTTDTHRGNLVKKFNAFDVYTLGKQLFPVSQLSGETFKYKDILFPLYLARQALLVQVREDSILPAASKRAAWTVIHGIDEVVARDVKEAFTADGEQEVMQYRINNIKSLIDGLETVLNNDMPGISTFLVVQKGIYRTDDLIEHAENNFSEEIRKDIPNQAKLDFKEAGKCLAYEVPTACAFHLWRAIETVMCAYYERLTGQTVDDANIRSNWDAYIKALTTAKADSKITQFLDHIRKEYRNPQTHPNENVSVSQAFGLFGVASSSISQMILEIQKLPVRPAIALAAPAAANAP